MKRLATLVPCMLVLAALAGCGEGSANPDGGTCVDQDGDGFGEGCAAGPDCDDLDPTRAESCDPGPCAGGACGYAVCAGLSLADVAPAATRTYTVNADGGGDFLTIQACADAVLPGEECLVAPGAYGRTEITRGGEEGAWVVFRAAAPPDTSAVDWDALFDPAAPEVTPANPVLNAATQGFSIRASYVRVENFEVSEIETPGVALVGRGAIHVRDASHVEIVRNFIHDANAAVDTYNYVGIRGESLADDDVRVAHNTLYRNQGTGILVTGTNWLVECNDVSHTLDSLTSDGVEVGGDSDATRFFGVGHVIRNNYLHDLLDEEQVGSPHIDAFQVFSVYPESQYAHDILVEGNYVHRTGQVLMSEDSGESGGGVNAVHGITFRGNVFRGARAQGVIVSDMNDHFTFVHNVVTGTTYAPINVSGGSHHAIVLDNVFYLNGEPDSPAGAALTDVASQPGSVWDHNAHFPDFSWPEKVPAYDVHGMFGVDPLFIDAAQGDYRVIGSSPLCGAASDGTDIGAFPCVRCDGDTPVPYILLDRSAGWDPLPVALDATKSLSCGASASYAWAFGDGGTAAEGVVSHVFGAGEHLVRLTVTNDQGVSASVTKVVSVTASVLPNLVLGLHLEGDVADWSGKGNAVAWRDGAGAYAAGRAGQAASFDGTATGASIEVQHQTVLDGMPALSLALWARKDAAAIGGRVIHKHVTYTLAIDGDGATGGVTTAGGEAVSVTASAVGTADTAWHHYALVHDGASVTLYVDGAAAGSSAASGPVAHNPDRPIAVGRDPWGDCFAGALDELRIYDKALSAAEVAALVSSH